MADLPRNVNLYISAGVKFCSTVCPLFPISVKRGETGCVRCVGVESVCNTVCCTVRCVYRGVMYAVRYAMIYLLYCDMICATECYIIYAHTNVIYIACRQHATTRQCSEKLAPRQHRSEHPDPPNKAGRRSPTGAAARLSVCPCIPACIPSPPSSLSRIPDAPGASAPPPLCLGVSARICAGASERCQPLRARLRLRDGQKIGETGRALCGHCPEGIMRGVLCGRCLAIVWAGEAGRPAEVRCALVCAAQVQVGMGSAHAGGLPDIALRAQRYSLPACCRRAGRGARLFSRCGGGAGVGAAAVAASRGSSLENGSTRTHRRAHTACTACSR